MSAPGRAALAELEALGHLDLLDAPDTHSRRHEPEPEEAQRLFDQGLGARRLSVFRALHRGALERLESSLSRPADAEDLEARGRVRRLLGRLAEADADLKKAGTPRAASWRAEALVYSKPDKALAALAKADERDPWSAFWTGAALIKAIRPKEARAPLERAAELFGADAPVVFKLVLAQARMTAKDFAGAKAALEQAAALDPASPAAPSMLGHLAHRTGDAAEAMARFHQARDLDMDVAGSYLFEGLGLDLTWDEPLAYMAALDRAIARSPKVGALYAERAELLRDPRFCRYEEAIRDYGTAARLEPKAAWMTATLARAVNKAGGPKEGLADFDRAAQLAPNSGWIRAWRGAALARAGRADEAFADFAAAQKLMPWYSFTYAWRGAVYTRLKRFDEACADLDLAVELVPPALFSRSVRFQARAGRGDYEGAVADLNACFHADPKYTWLGRAGAAGLPALDAAAAARPGLGWLRAWRGFSLLELGRVKAAALELDAAAKLLPEEPQVRSWRARALAASGREELARREYAACLKLDPGLWTAHRGLAELDAAAGNWKDAYKRLRKVAALTPTTVSAYMEAADAAARLGRDKDALADLARALELDPGYAKALAARGALRERGGDAKGAAADFRAAYKIDPGVFPPEAREAVRRFIGEKK